MEEFSLFTPKECKGKSGLEKKQCLVKVRNAKFKQHILKHQADMPKCDRFEEPKKTKCKNELKLIICLLCNANKV
jgi:hypothetical protein